MRTRAGFFMPTVYTKPTLTFDQQIDLLQSRGLLVPYGTKYDEAEYVIVLMSSR